MSRMSARFVVQKVGMTTQWVYDMWKDMALLTAYRNAGGRLELEKALREMYSRGKDDQEDSFLRP